MNQGLQYELDQVMPAARETGLFSSLCSITESPGSFGSSGAPNPATAWVPRNGLQNIPCTAPPSSEISISATELKALEEVLSLQVKHVLLNDYFPQIVPYNRAVIDGVVYDIMGAESDSQKRQTRMDVRLAAI